MDNLTVINLDKLIEAHRSASSYLAKAASLHQRAAKYYEQGDGEKAVECSIAAHAFQSFAVESERTVR